MKRAICLGIVVGVSACGPTFGADDTGADTGEASPEDSEAADGAESGSQGGSADSSSGGGEPTSSTMGDDAETGDDPESAWCLRGTPELAIEPDMNVAAVADTNGDGRDEVWTVEHLWDPVTEVQTTRVVVFGLEDVARGSPHLQPLAELDRSGFAFALADIDGDGALDVLMSQWDGRDTWWLAGTGDLSVGETPSPLSIPSTQGLRFDVDGDGAVDHVATHPDRVTLHMGDGGGGFAQGDVLTYRGELGSLDLVDSGVPGEPIFVTTELILGFGSELNRVLRIGVTGNGDLDVLASSDNLDFTVAGAADLDGDGRPEVMGMDVITNTGPIVLQEDRGGTYAKLDFRASTKGLLFGALTDIGSHDLLAWDSLPTGMRLRIWSDGAWSDPAPVSIEGAWGSWGETHVLDVDGAGGEEILRRGWGDSDAYGLWRLEPCE